MSYLGYLCLLTYSGVQHILCCVVFLFCLSSSCVPYVASFSRSGSSFLTAPLVFSKVKVLLMLLTSVYLLNF
jgi:hypothetical protein